MGRLVPLALILLTLPASAARAAQWFVAPGGNDAGPGTSSQPFATIQRGADAAVGGDTVTVRAGLYAYAGAQDGMAVNLSKAGSPAAGRITIAAEAPGAAVLDGGALAHSYFNLTSSAAFVSIRGFEIRNTRWSGVWANGTAAKDVVVQANSIHDVGFRTETSSFGIAGVFANAAAAAWTIDGNTIYAIGRSSGNMTGALDHGLYIAGSSFTVRNNVFSQLRNGWHIQLADGFSGKIANNTFFGPDPVGSQPGQMILWNRSGNLEIKNNLFYGPRTNAIHTLTASVSGLCQLQNNLAFSTSGAVGLIAAAPAGCVQSGNVLNTDPQALSPSAADPRLAAAGPAKDAGLTLVYVPADYYGTKRPQGPAYDIGAFEAAYSTVTLFTTQVPAAGTNSLGAGSIELGVRLKADVNGLVTAIRFYKNSANATGPHTGHLWSGGGALLGSVTFTGESAGGWQTAVFAKPIAVYSTATYVASYHTPGGYPVARNYFVSQFNHAPLHAPADGSSAHDGGYQYGAGAIFPNQGVSASNYWVDAVFSYSTGAVVSSTTINPVPAVTSFSPSSGTAGSPAFTLKVFGAGFVAGSTGLWNGAPRATTFVSGAQLSVAISSADLAAAATDFVSVVSPGPGGGPSASAPFLVGNPPPAVASLSPSSATAGGPGFTLTVLGSGLVSTSTVLWNGAGRPTTFLSKTALAIALSSADVAAAGSNLVAVFTAQPGGGRSSNLAFAVASSSGPPPPPPPPPAGSTATLFGTLGPASSQWSADAQSVELGVRFFTDLPGQVAALRFYKQPQMTGAHTGHLWSSAGALLGSVTFTGESASGWQTASFSSPVPISSGFVYLASFHAAGGYAATRGYFATAGFDNPPLHALKDAAGAPDGAYIYSASPAFPTQGHLSTNFWVDPVVSYSTTPAAAANPLPVIASLSPSSATAGDAGFALRVLGTGFVSTSTVLWNGAGRATVFLSTGELSAVVLTSDLAAGGTAQIRVFTSGPGGGLSPSAPFPIAPLNPVPSIAALSPSSATVGAAAFALRVDGTGFSPGASGLWNGAARPTVVVSSVQLSVSLSTADLAAAATDFVSVFNPGPGGGTSTAAGFLVANPPPEIAALSPSSATAGSPGFTLQVLGSGFVSTSTVLWNGAGRATVFVGSAALTIDVSSADVASAGASTVTVFTAGPGGGLSAPEAFAIAATNPAPVLLGADPSTATAGGPGFLLKALGAGFVSTSTVLWNGTARPTAFVDSGTLTIQLSTADAAAAGDARVEVFTAAPGGGLSSSATVSFLNPVPSISALSPSTGVAGSSLTLTVSGEGLVSTSTVLWNGSPRAALSRTVATVSIALSTADLAAVGVATVAVFNAAPGGGLSDPSAFSIVNPAPVLLALSPSSATAGGAGLTLTLLGAGFVSSSTAVLNGQSRDTAFLSSAALSVELSSGDVVSTGTISAAVFTAGPGGGLSAPKSLTLGWPAPAIASLSPSSATAGDAAFALQVLGSGFVSTSTVLWNGRARPTAFVDTGTLTAQISTADVASGALDAVTVFTAAPGGGLSSSGTFAVFNPAPAIAALDPSTAAAGGPAFSLRVLGAGFVPGSTALWNGSARATVFLSSSALSASIAPADIASSGTASVAVLNDAPGGGLSDPAPFPIAPAPDVSTGPWTAAYYAGWLAARLPIDQVDLGAVDAIIHFSVQPNSDGSLNRASNSLSTAAVQALVATVHGAGKKALFSCGGWQTESAFVSAMNSTHQATFVSSLVNFMTAGGYDGIDLDMEPIAANEVASYVSFVKALRARMDAVQPGSLITAAVDWQPQAFAQLTNEMDHINLLAYVLAGPYVGQTWHDSAILSPSSTSTLRSLDSLVRTYLAAGVPAYKLGAAVTFDGFTWTGGSGVSAPYQKWTSAPGASETAYFTTADQYGLSETSAAAHPLYRWDPVAMSPYISFSTSPASKSQFIPFNDASSIYEKYRYARAKGLGSMIVWNLANGYRPQLPPGRRDGLLQAVKRGRFDPPPLNAAPALSSIEPAGAAPGSGAFTLTARGAGFTPGSVVRWKGSARPTQYQDAGMLTAQIAAADVSAAGTAAVTVFTPAPAGGESAISTFTIAAPMGFAAAALNPAPTIEGVSLTRASGSSLELGVTGGGFVEPSRVCWNGAPLPTTFVSGSALVGKLSSSSAAPDGRGLVTVHSPEPGGGVSNASTVTAAGYLGCPPPPPRREDTVPTLARGVVVFSPAAQGSVVEIFTPQGKLVRSVPAARGQAVWDLTDAAGRRVAPGRYLYNAVAPDGRRGGGTVTVPVKL